MHTPGGTVTFNFAIIIARLSPSGPPPSLISHSLGRETACTFYNVPERKGPGRIDREKMAKVTWTKPAVVAEIAFKEETSAAHLRHAAFLRLLDGGDLRRI